MPNAEQAQRQFYEESPWLLECKFFESILFEPPDNPSGSLIQAILDAVASARSLANLADKHADDAELIAQMLQGKEKIIASLHADFMRPHKEETPLAPLEPAPTPLNSSPAASSTGEFQPGAAAAKPQAPGGAPPQREQWRVKAPPPTLAGPPLAAARQHRSNQGPHRTGQPLQAKPRTALDFIDHAGVELRPTVAAALKRIGV